MNYKLNANENDDVNIIMRAGSDYVRTVFPKGKVIGIIGAAEKVEKSDMFKGFEICVKEAAPKALMTSYNLLNGTHTANRGDLISTVLRKEWGFEGIVMTDWGTTNDKFNLGVYGASSPALCIKAGNDLMMSGSKEDVEGILTGLKDGTITRAELEACAGRILALSKELS